MNLYNSISRRRSCRSYQEANLSNKELEAIKDALENFRLLYPDLPLKFRFASETKGMFNVKAPHYLVISGSGKAGEQVNAGFIGQQLVLWLDAHDYGAVWLGGSKDSTETFSKSDIIVMAFGWPAGPFRRSLEEFKRKPIENITNDPLNNCIQAVHLAPSGMNFQPWYLKKKDNKVLFYREILKPHLALAYKLTRIDMGIALCHYFLACEKEGRTFNFTLGGQAPRIRGYKYYGYVES